MKAPPAEKIVRCFFLFYKKAPPQRRSEGFLFSISKWIEIYSYTELSRGYNQTCKVLECRLKSQSLL